MGVFLGYARTQTAGQGEVKVAARPGELENGWMDAIHNERVRLTATALNNTGIASVVTGMIAPVAGALYGTTAPSYRYWWAIALAWLCGGIALHIGARHVLRSLRL